MSFKRKVKRRKESIGRRVHPLSYTSLKETVSAKETYTSKEMFFMSREERHGIVKAAIDKDEGYSFGLFEEDCDDVYAHADGIYGFCADRRLIVRDWYGGVIPESYFNNFHEAYLVESTRSDHKGQMGVLYFPYSLSVDLDEEDFRLVVLDMKLKAAS